MRKRDAIKSLVLCRYLDILSSGMRKLNVGFSKYVYVYNIKYIITKPMRIKAFTSVLYVSCTLYSLIFLKKIYS